MDLDSESSALNDAHKGERRERELRKLQSALLLVTMTIAVITTLSVNIHQVEAATRKISISPCPEIGSNFAKVDGIVISTSVLLNWETGSTHTLEAYSPVVVGNEKYIWLRWEINGNSLYTQTLSYTVPSGSSPSALPITAYYQVQHYLAINSAHGSPTGEGWYNDGKTAYFSVTSPDTAAAIRYVTTGYSGNAIGSGDHGSIVMGAPKTVTFGWDTQYQVSFAVNPSGGGKTNPSSIDYYNAGTSLEIHATANTGYFFDSWTATETISITDSTHATINSPGTITANFQNPAIPTWLSISCSPPTVDKSGSMHTTIDIKLALASDHNTGISGKALTISYFDGSTWQILPATGSTDSNGLYAYDWSVPATLPNGPHIVAVAFAGDPDGSNPKYAAANAETDGTSGGSGLFVVPEYLLGPFAALVACITGFLVFKTRNKRERLN